MAYLFVGYGQLLLALGKQFLGVNGAVTADEGYDNKREAEYDGKKISAFGLSECQVINGNYYEKKVCWNDGTSDVNALAGQPIRLRLAFRGTKLYSFRFGP